MGLLQLDRSLLFGPFLWLSLFRNLTWLLVFRLLYEVELLIVVIVARVFS
jgi:hypothetical protein